MTTRVRPSGACWARGDWGDRCTDVSWHLYSHYDASSDTSWNDHPEDHPDGCTCEACQPDDSLPERDRRPLPAAKAEAPTHTCKYPEDSFPCRIRHQHLQTGWAKGDH